MADKSKSSASTTTDTSHRRTWDRTAYEAQAKAASAARREEAQARAEAEAAGKKYHRRAATPPDARETQARKARLDVASQVGKQTLVPAGSGVGKRGRSAGFYCEHCDLTFKDNLQYVDHLNSKQHLIATGQTGEVRRAGLEEVRERLAWLKRRRDEEKELEVMELGDRLEKTKDAQEKALEERRAARREKRRKWKEEHGKGDAGIKMEEVPFDGVISRLTNVT